MVAMDDQEKEELQWQALRRLQEIYSSAGPLENGKAIDPLAQAEIELILAESEMLGLLPEDASPRRCTCGRICRCEPPSGS